MKNFTQILDSLTREIKKKYPIVDIVQEHQCLQNSEDDVYQFINIVHVPESIISDVEDCAYGLLRTISPEKSLPIGFLLFTQEETAEKFPKYVRPETAEFTAQTACSFFQEARKPGKWQTSFSAVSYDVFTTPVTFDINFNNITGEQAGFPHVGVRGNAANKELALAA